MAVEFLHEPLLWGVTAWRLIAAALIVFFGFAARRLLIYIFKNVLAARARKTRVSWDDQLVRFIPPPLSALVVIALWFGAAALLDLPKEPIDIERYVFQGLSVALAVTLVWLLVSPDRCHGRGAGAGVGADFIQAGRSARAAVPPRPRRLSSPWWPA